MRISDWSSDVCSSDLRGLACRQPAEHQPGAEGAGEGQRRRLGPECGRDPEMRQADGAGEAETDADQPAEAADNQRLDVALQHDVETPRAGRHTDADLAGAVEIGRASGRARVCQYV